MANRLPLDYFSISFYVGAIKRNKKGDEPSHTLTICIYFSIFLYLLIIFIGNFHEVAPVRPPAFTGLLDRSAFLPLSQTDSIINDEAAPVRPPAFTGLLDRSTFIPSGQSDSIISESTPIDLQAPSPARSDGAVPLQQPLTQFENDQPSPDSPPVPEVRVPIGPASMVTSSSASIHLYGRSQGPNSGGRSHDLERFYPDHHRSRHSTGMDPAYDYYSPQEQRRSSFERLSRHSLSRATITLLADLRHHILKLL